LELFVLGFSLLDIILLLALLFYLIAGLRNGLVVTLGGIVGFVAGAVAAFFAIPLVAAWVPDDGWRLTAVIATVAVLVLGGHALGAALGGGIRRWLNFPPLRFLDRLLGGAVNLAVSALVMSMLAFSVNTLGVPFLSQQITSSKVLTTIDDATPDRVKAMTAQLRSFTLAEGLPTILDSAAPDTVVAPDQALSSAALQASSESVVKITGTAYQCGQNQTGSGFVVADDRVITNAHVVAGVPEPVVQVPGGGALPGKVVHFDSTRDLAVLAVENLDADPIPLGGVLPNDTTAAFAGYPAGGPFRLQAANVERLRDLPRGAGGLHPGGQRTAGQLRRSAAGHRRAGGWRHLRQDHGGAAHRLCPVPERAGPGGRGRRRLFRPGVARAVHLRRVGLQ
jgi:uncharacterized membrane protein required for colicin V production